MKILFCYGNSLDPCKGGVQRVTDILANYLILHGHKVSYLIHDAYKTDDYEYPVEVYYLPRKRLNSSKNKRFYSKVIEENGIDIVVNHDATNKRSYFFLNTRKSIIIKISLYHQDPIYGLKGVHFSSKGLKKILMKLCLRGIEAWRLHSRKKQFNYLLRNSNTLVLLSEHFKRDVEKILRIEISRIHAINNPIVDSKNSSDHRKSQKVLFVARMEIGQKRPDLMLSIWEMIVSNHRDWELIFLGDGPDLNKLKAYVNELKIENVRFMGFVDPKPYYQDASIICLTSEYEGQGLALLEGMQFGVVPVSFHKWESIKDIIIDGKTGFLVKNGDIHEYAAKLENLMIDSSLRERLSKEAQVHSNRFLIGKIGPLWLDLFQKLLREKNTLDLKLNQQRIIK